MFKGGGSRANPTKRAAAPPTRQSTRVNKASEKPEQLSKTTAKQVSTKVRQKLDEPSPGLVQATEVEEAKGKDDDSSSASDASSSGDDGESVSFGGVKVPISNGEAAPIEKVNAEATDSSRDSEEEASDEEGGVALGTENAEAKKHASGFMDALIDKLEKDEAATEDVTETETLKPTADKSIVKTEQKTKASAPAEEDCIPLGVVSNQNTAKEAKKVKKVKKEQPKKEDSSSASKEDVEMEDPKEQPQLPVQKVEKKFERPSNCLFIDEWAPETTEEQIRALFSPFGELVRVKKAEPRRRCGHVEFSTESAAVSAVHALDGSHGLSIDFAIPKDASFAEKAARKEAKNTPENSPYSLLTMLFITNVPNDVSDQELRDLVHQYGKTKGFIALTDPKTGDSNGQLYVNYTSNTEAWKALDGLKQTKLRDHALRVDFNQSFGSTHGNLTEEERGAVHRRLPKSWKKEWIRQLYGKSFAHKKGVEARSEQNKGQEKDTHSKQKESTAAAIPEEQKAKGDNGQKNKTGRPGQKERQRQRHLKKQEVRNRNQAPKATAGAA